MSRLHSLRATFEDVASFLGVEGGSPVAIPGEVTEGGNGLVAYEAGGHRRLRLMRWGFPRPIRDRRMEGREADIVGLVADITNPMWEGTVVDPRYRCVVPITHFANPEGDVGAKTRTWFSLQDQPIMAWAGFCRNMPDVGPCYAGMTMEANAAIPPTNDRMPVLLELDEIDPWLRGSIQDVIRFQYRAPFAADRMEVMHTDDAWRNGGPPPSFAQMPLI